MRIKKKRATQRVLLSLPPELYDTISRLSAAMEKPRAEIIRELLAQQQPMLDLMANAFEQAREGHKEKAAVALQKLAGEALMGLGEAMSPRRGHKTRTWSW